jgi:hypothetical protein
MIKNPHWVRDCASETAASKDFGSKLSTGAKPEKGITAPPKSYLRVLRIEAMRFPALLPSAIKSSTCFTARISESYFVPKSEQDACDGALAWGGVGAGLFFI